MPKLTCGFRHTRQQKAVLFYSFGLRIHETGDSRVERRQRQRAEEETMALVCISVTMTKSVSGRKGFNHPVHLGGRPSQEPGGMLLAPHGLLSLFSYTPRATCPGVAAPTVG